jgi:hypothetical protein
MEEMAEFSHELEHYYDHIVSLEGKEQADQDKGDITEVNTSSRLEKELEELDKWQNLHLKAFKIGDRSGLNHSWEQIAQLTAKDIDNEQHNTPISKNNEKTVVHKRVKQDKVQKHSNMTEQEKLQGFKPGAYDPKGNAMSSPWANKWALSKERGIKTLDNSIMSTHYWIKIESHEQTAAENIIKDLHAWFGTSILIHTICEIGLIILFKEDEVQIAMVLDDIGRRAMWPPQVKITEGLPERKYVVKVGPIDSKDIQDHYGPLNSGLVQTNLVQDMVSNNEWLKRGVVEPYKYNFLPESKKVNIFLRVSKGIFDEAANPPYKNLNIYIKLGRERQVQWSNTYSLDWCTRCLTKDHRVNAQGVKEPCSREPFCSKCYRKGHSSLDCQQSEGQIKCQLCDLLLEERVKKQTNINHRPLTYPCMMRKMEERVLKLTHYLQPSAFHDAKAPFFFDLNQYM